MDAASGVPAPSPARREPRRAPFLRSRGCGALRGAARTAGSGAFGERSEDAIREQRGPQVGTVHSRLQVWLCSRCSISSVKKHAELQMKRRTPYPEGCFCAGCRNGQSCTAGSVCCRFGCWEMSAQCSQRSQGRRLHPRALGAALGPTAPRPPAACEASLLAALRPSGSSASQLPAGGRTRSERS